MILSESGTSSMLKKDSFSERITAYGSNGDVRKAIIKPLESKYFNASNKLDVYAAWVGDDDLTLVHTFERAQRDKNAFQLNYHFSLDEHGLLALHAAEVPYLLVDENHLENFIRLKGSVLKLKMESVEDNTLNVQREPFSGIH